MEPHTPHNGIERRSSNEDRSTARRDGADLSLDTTFDLLKNRRRRDTLVYLLAHDGRGTLSDLAEHIAALENGIDESLVSSDQRKRVYIGLYQAHLPKLDGAGVVDWDRDRGTVVLQPEAEQLLAYLPGADDENDADADTGVVRRAALWVASTAAVGVVSWRALALVVGGFEAGLAALLLTATLGVTVAVLRLPVSGGVS